MKLSSGNSSKKSIQSIEDTLLHSKNSISQTKLLSQSRNSFSNLKHSKSKINDKSAKDLKLVKGSLCDSGSSISLVTPNNKKLSQDSFGLPPTGSSLKPGMKKIKEKLQRSQNTCEKKLKLSEESFQNINTFDSKEEIDKKLINTESINGSSSKLKTKSSISLDFNATNFSEKDLSDLKFLPKPQKSSKASKLKTKLSDDSKKPSKHSSTVSHKKTKTIATEILLNNTDDIKKELKLSKERKSAKHFLKPKLKSLKLKPCRKTADISPKASNLNFSVPKEQKPIKGIIKPSKFPKPALKVSIESQNLLRSDKSSVVQTETDEWVNVLDYKFQGPASGFVEEFKAKISEDFPAVPTVPNELDDAQVCTYLSTNENLRTEDFNICEVNPNGLPVTVKPKPEFVPRLELGRICHADSFLSSENGANATNDIMEFISSRSCFNTYESKVEKSSPYDTQIVSMRFGSLSNKKIPNGKNV